MRGELVVIGNEPHGNYNRILLSQVLSGEKVFADTVLNDADWYAEHGIALLAGRKAVAINRARHRVVTGDGNLLPYDRPVLATGAKPLLPTLPGTPLKGIVTFCAVADVDTMLERAALPFHRSACRTLAFKNDGAVVLSAQ